MSTQLKNLLNMGSLLISTFSSTFVACISALQSSNWLETFFCIGLLIILYKMYADYKTKAYDITTGSTLTGASVIQPIVSQITDALISSLNGEPLVNTPSPTQGSSNN